MAFSIPEAEVLNTDIVYDLKWVISEESLGEFQLASASWSLKDSAGAEVLSGAGIVDNADADQDDSEVHSVQVTLDLADVEPGEHFLSVLFTDTAGGGDVFRVPVSVVDYREIPGG